MTELTKEWLLRTIAELEEERDSMLGVVNEDAAMALAAMKLALASLEAEAVCVIDQSNLDYLKSGSDADVWPASRAEMGDVLLYRSATPSPVAVPEGYRLQPISEYDAMCAAMLQGAENAESRCTIQTAPVLDSLPKIAESRCSNSPVIPDGLRLALSNAGIAAPESDEMLAATCEKYIQEMVTWVKERKPFQPAQLAPDGWVACSERMPESNKYVLVCNGVWVGMGLYNGGEQFEDCERWQDEHGEFIDLLHHPVSHWIPLPEAPQQEGE
ncbi:TPA: DUF551 domain-containing protein [Enterobacter roggenkampii]